MWEGPYWEGVWPFLDPWEAVGLLTTASAWNVPGKYGPYGKRFFFLIKKELFALTNAVEFRPRGTAETLMACALIDVRITAAEATRSFSGISLDLGDMWRCGCPKSPDWSTDADVWAESECTPRFEVYEHNNECRALEVVVHDWSSVSLS